jgi:hypothetical protein
MKKSILNILLLALLSPSILAGLLIEPYVGYNLGMSSDYKATVSGAAGAYKSSPTAGPEYGGRLGYSFLGLFVAADYSMLSFDSKDTITTLDGSAVTGTEDKSSVDQTAMGLAVGYELPILLRVWGKYLFDVGWDVNNTTLTPTTTEEISGSGIAVGLGFTALPFLNIYAEYQSVTMDTVDKATTSSGDVKANYTDYERKRTSITIGISLPLDI